MVAWARVIRLIHMHEHESRYNCTVISALYHGLLECCHQVLGQCIGGSSMRHEAFGANAPPSLTFSSQQWSKVATELGEIKLYITQVAR